MPSNERETLELQARLQQALDSAYDIQRRLPGGGMSTVFLATDKALKRRVVIKVLPRELAGADAIDRFQREIALVAALQHPQVVAILAAGDLDGLPYFVMPFVEGESLRKRLARGPMSIRETVSTLVDITRALAYAHEHGVVHRDIKPDNILLTSSSAVVSDFGIAKAAGSSRHRPLPSAASTPAGEPTTEGMSLGTPAYMAPEQVVGDPGVDHRADLYSLGLVAYEMLVGTSPYSGLAPHQVLMAQISQTPPPISMRRADVPPALDELIMRCIAKRAELRPRTAGDVLRTLQNPATLAPPERRVSAKRGPIRRAIGGIVQLLRDDLRAAARGLMRSPTVSVSAVACLALGIGVTAAVFSAVDRALLQSLPVLHPEELVTVYRTTPHFNTGPFSAPNYTDLAAGSRTLSSMAALSPGTALVSVGETTIQARRLRATGNTFTTIGTTPLRGRLFGPADDAPGQSAVVVLSEEFWRSRFGGDTTLISRTIPIDGTPRTVIGILPSGFRIPHGFQVIRADLWVPMQFADSELSQRRSNYLLSFGRLAEGATADGATRELVGLFDRVVESNPELAGESVRVLPLQAESVANVRTPLLLLLGAVAIVLIIATTNVASLLLARGVQLQREFAIRTALGASRWNVMRPVFAESIVLAGVGVALGLALAWAGVRSIGALAAQRMPQLAGLSVDLRVIGVALVLSLVASVVCAAVPAWRSTRVDPQDALRSGRGGGSERRHHLALGTLVIVEGALSLVLLIGAGLVLKGFVQVLGYDPGFVTRNVLTMEARISPTDYQQGSSVKQFLEPALTAAASVPGVQSAGAISQLPYRDWGWNFNLRYEGQPGDNPTALPITELRNVTPGFFAVTGQRLLAGRLLDDRDDATNASAVAAVVVNNALVQRDFPAGDAIGRRFYWGDDLVTIVGVVSDIRNFGPVVEPRPEIYWNFAQRGTTSTGFNIVVRVDGDPAAAAGAIQNAIRAVDPGVAISNVMPMDDVVAASVGRPRFLASLIGGFAVVAVLLAAAGLYGVLSYSVAQRARELGIRTALGSSRTDLMWLVARRGAVLVGIGIAIGLPASFGATRLMVSMLYGVSPADVGTWVLGTLALVAAGTLAIVIPALRATRVDPIIAMRAE